jgi:hypothetical protein
MARMKHSQVAKKVAKKITGFSTPLGGLNWQIPEDNTSNEIRRLLTFLEDRRLFHIVDDKAYEVRSGHLRRPQYVTDSVLKVRDEITECMKSMEFPKRTQDSLEQMRRACRTYLASPSIGAAGRQMGRGGRMSISEAVGRFRTAMGIEIAKLCADYAIDVEEELTPLVSYALKHTPDISQLP